MIDRLNFDPLSGQTANHRIYIKDGKRYDTPYSMYAYHVQDIEKMGSSHGLRINMVFGNWKGDRLDKDSRRIIAVFDKV